MSILVLQNPDALELFIAGHVDVLPPCPFCGEDVLMRSEQNDTSRLFKATIFCTNRDCSANVWLVDYTREEAQRKVFALWARRAPLPTREYHLDSIMEQASAWRARLHQSKPIVPQDGGGKPEHPGTQA